MIVWAKNNNMAKDTYDSTGRVRPVSRNTPKEEMENELDMVIIAVRTNRVRQYLSDCSRYLPQEADKISGLLLTELIECSLQELQILSSYFSASRGHHTLPSTFTDLPGDPPRPHEYRTKTQDIKPIRAKEICPRRISNPRLSREVGPSKISLVDNVPINELDGEECDLCCTSSSFEVLTNLGSHCCGDAMMKASKVLDWKHEM